LKSSIKNIAEPLLFFGGLLLLWEFLVRMTDIPDFILPPPRDLYTAFAENLYVIAIHSVVTFAEAVGGFALSFILGVGFAISVVYSRHLQNTIYPLIWIGYGMFSKMSIAFLVAFFPIVVNTVVGLKEVEPELLDLARINRASQFDIFTKIRLPNSLPYLFAGVKVALILSVTGAIVAEFVAANQGLGYLIMQALYSLDTALTLVILFILALLSLGLFMMVQVLQRKIAPWSAEVRQIESSF